jgi:exodeoxyribonuclease III
MTLNIRHGGGKRIGPIVQAIAAYSPDIVIITEYRNGRVGENLRSSLSVAGWEHQIAAPTPERKNSVLIVAKQPIEIDDQQIFNEDWQRDRHIVVNGGGYTIVAVYLPPGPKKLPSWELLLNTAATLATEPTLIIGDFNTGKHYIDEDGATFIGPENIDRLEKLNYIDAWRHLHPTARDYTWFSPAGNGFRLDFAFLSPSLATKLTSARHIHETRIDTITDHSGLVVEIGWF